MPRKVLGPRIWIMPMAPGGTDKPVSVSTMRTSVPSNGLPHDPQADSGMSVSAGYPQYGPNASVIPNSLARAPGAAR
jgi:hypothetical protein